MWISYFVLCSAILQSLATGCFLTLDVATEELAKSWNFDADHMTQIGTFGYSLGFTLVGLFFLFFLRKLSSTIIAIIGGTITITSWIIIRHYLCEDCLHWILAALTESGVACGTAISYIAGIQLLRRHYHHPEKRKWMLLSASLSVSLGSLLCYIIFAYVNNIDTVLLCVISFSLFASIFLIICTQLPDQSEVEAEEPIIASEKKNFSSAFAVYLFAVNLSFGLIVTLTNSSRSMLIDTGSSWGKKKSLILFSLVANIFGRFLGFLVKSKLRVMLHYFGAVASLIGVLHLLLLRFWNIWLIFGTLIISSIFFGGIWSLSMSMGSEFFQIAEDRSLSNVFFGMSAGPLVFGQIFAGIYKIYQYEGRCDSHCYHHYLIFAGVSSLIAAAGYHWAYFVQRKIAFRLR